MNDKFISCAVNDLINQPRDTQYSLGLPIETTVSLLQELPRLDQTFTVLRPTDRLAYARAYEQLTDLGVVAALSADYWKPGDQITEEISTIHASRFIHAKKSYGFYKKVSDVEGMSRVAETAFLSALHSRKFPAASVWAQRLVRADRANLATVYDAVNSKSDHAQSLKARLYCTYSRA